MAEYNGMPESGAYIGELTSNAEKHKNINRSYENENGVLFDGDIYVGGGSYEEYLARNGYSDPILSRSGLVESIGYYQDEAYKLPKAFRPMFPETEKVEFLGNQLMGNQKMMDALGGKAGITQSLVTCSEHLRDSESLERVSQSVESYNLADDTAAHLGYVSGYMNEKAESIDRFTYSREDDEVSSSKRDVLKAFAAQTKDSFSKMSGRFGYAANRLKLDADYARDSLVAGFKSNTLDASVEVVNGLNLKQQVIDSANMANRHAAVFDKKLSNQGLSAKDYETMSKWDQGIFKASTQPMKLIRDICKKTHTFLTDRLVGIHELERSHGLDESSRNVEAFDRRNAYESAREDLMKAEIERIQDTEPRRCASLKAELKGYQDQAMEREENRMSVTYEPTKETGFEPKGYMPSADIPDCTGETQTEVNADFAYA